MKKVIATAAAAVLLIMLFSVMVFAQDTAQITVTADNLRPAQGDTVKFTVRLNACTSPMSGLTFKLDIPQGFEYVNGSASVPGDLRDKLGAYRTDFTEESKIFFCGGAGEYTSSSQTVLMTFSLKAVGQPADYVIGIKDINMVGPVNSADNQIPDIQVSSVPSYVTVTKAVSDGVPTVVVGSVKSRAGQLVEVPVSLMNNPGITGLSVKIDYPSSLKLVGVKDCGILGTQVHGSDSATLAGKPYTLSWSNGTSKTDYKTADGEPVAILCFEVADGTPLGYLDITASFTDGAAVNAAGAMIDFDTVDGGADIIDFIYGDVDRDGEVTVIDIVLLCRWYAGLDDDSGIDLLAADVDGSGDVSVRDIIILCNHVAEKDGFEILPYLG